ncbi:MAG TPA: phage integrase N-terminal SAM-like domain-containing protein [Verrucomicrobiae bacterium]|nr:phage integrase N-terminal SAM-like domain-containing protein [Verrucomicrobiae bacterium]
MAWDKGSQREREIASRNSPGARDLIIPNPKLKLLDQVREVMRIQHYSIRTERCYCDWIRRYIRFHQMKARDQLLGGAEAKMEEFLSDLAVNGRVTASTQNQAFNALLFLYKRILHRPLENVQAVRADRPVRIPVVLTPEEVKQVIQAMAGTPQLVAKILYGSGLRLMEGLRLRVQDLDFQMQQLTVRDGKGAKDRITVLPKSILPVLHEHLERTRLRDEESVGWFVRRSRVERRASRATLNHQPSTFWMAATRTLTRSRQRGTTLSHPMGEGRLRPRPSTLDRRLACGARSYETRPHRGSAFLAQSRFLRLSISCEMESRHLDCYEDERLKDRVRVFLTFVNFVCFCEYSRPL